MAISTAGLDKIVHKEKQRRRVNIKSFTSVPSHSMGILCLFVLFLLLPVSGFTQEEEREEELQEEYAPELNLDDLRRRIYGEAPSELMSVKLGDAEVSLFISGSWKGDLQFNPGYFFSKRGSGFTASDTPFFMQEADLTLALWIDRWFVEANFLDDSSQNTYRAGFQGRPGEFLQYAGIGNTGLDFPSFAYMDLGGDSPSSFGFYSRFGRDDLNFHALFRYDSSSREERTFSGTRERTFSFVQPQNPVRGISFILPDTEIDSQITVYIEDEKGDIRDTSGRRWRQALSTEYAASRIHGLLELSVRPQGMAAVYYTKNGERPWNMSMGSYDGSQNGFLTIIQNWFSSGGKAVRLDNYPQAGSRNSSDKRPGEVIFNEGAALVIYESGAFSPFESLNRYDAPSSESEQAVIIRLSSGVELNGFRLVLYDTGFDNDDFFTFTSASSRRGVYELIKEGSYSRRDPTALFPLADEHPEIYLPGSGVVSSDIVLRFTNYNNTNGYFIGTDVVPGSVQVWRSGIQDSNFSYNSSSGEVLIYGSVGQNELIRVTYLKRSEETRFGSIAAGVGAVYKKTDNFSAQAALGIRFNMSEDSYTEDNNSSMGNAAFSAKAAWDYDSFKAYTAGGFALEQADTTGLYRAAGMEGHETILSLPQENSFLSNPHFSEISGDLTSVGRSDLIYRNYYSNSVLGPNLLPIEANSAVVTGINRPYPAKDPQLGNANVLTAEFNFNDGGWTGFQSPLYNVSDLLSRSGEIEIPFRFYGLNRNPPADFKVIVQIGSLSGKDFAFTENPALIWEKILYENDMNVTDPNSFYSSTAFNHNARIARFRLTDDDRKKLGDAKHLRLVIVYKGSENLAGRVLLANPIVRGAEFRPVAFDGTVNGNTGKVRAIETIDTGDLLEKTYPDIVDRFHKTRSQRVLRIDWEKMEAGFSAGADGQLNEIPLSDYRELSFFVKINNERITKKNESLKFIISDSSETINNNHLEGQIPLNVFRAEKWQKVTIRYQGDKKGISVDGLKIDSASFNYKPQRVLFDSSERRTSYIIFLFNPQDSSAALEDGTVFIDEIILEDSCLAYRMNFGAGIDYSKRGRILSLGKVDFLSDFSVSTALESEARAGIEVNDDAFYGSVVSRTGMGISLFGIKLKGNVSFTAAENLFLWSADHSLSRTIGAFSLNEAFYASPYENTARHTFNIGFLSNFHAKFDADALYDMSKLKQNWKLDLGYRPKNEYIPSVEVNTQLLWTKENKTEEGDSYGKIWADSWEDLIPDAGEGAQSRKSNAQFILTQRTKPVGAVITVDGSALFSSANSVTRLENSAFLDIPVVTDKINFNLRAGRTFRQQLDYSGENVFDDGRLFLDSADDSFIFWKTIPLYSLFAPELNDTMDRGASDSIHSSVLQYMSFNDHFSAGINFLSVYNLASFLLPARISFRLERVIEQKMDTRADVLNVAGSLGFSSINMFGALGYLPLFKFYQSDEFSHGIEAAFVIPNSDAQADHPAENVKWRIQSAARAGFRLTDKGSVNLVNTFTVRNDDSWLESFNAIWEAPAPKSLIGLFYKWITTIPEKQSSWLTLSFTINSNYEQLRRESLELIFDKTGDYLRWSLIAGHEEIVRITGRFNLSGFVKLKMGEDFYSEIFSVEALLGISLRISF